MGTNGVVDRCGALYGAGGWTGTAVGLAFGSAHLGRNALYQSGNAGLGNGLGRLAYDGRTWGSVSRTWSKAAGGLKSQGQHLHHWLFPQRRKWVPAAIRNAGFNYLPIGAGRNSWMNGRGLLPIAAEYGLTGVVVGIYGSLLPSSGGECKSK